MPTIIDVADKAGVSFKTVSRVLNGEPNVRDTTRQKVLEAAEALNFTLNHSARSLRSHNPPVIALIVQNPASSYAHELQLGILKGCQDVGYRLIVEATQQPQVPDTLMKRKGLAGIILGPPQADQISLVRHLATLDFPFVRLATELDIDSTPRISVDESGAAFDAVSHLIGLGHRDIAMIEGADDQHASKLRRAGYEAAMKRAGLPVRPDLILPGDFTFESGRIAAETLLKRTDRPTAVFAANDDMAAGCLAAAYRYNIRIPDDLSIIGFDDSASARLVYPALSTIRQSTIEMATSAVKWLDQMRRGKTSPTTHRIIPHELIIRQSSAAPAEFAVASS